MSGQLDRLLAAIGAAPDLERGLCAWQWDLFDNTEDPAAVEQAVELCRQCPALNRCSDWLAGLPPRRRPIGVIAGVVRKPR